MNTLRERYNRKIFEWSTLGKSQFLLFLSLGLMSFNLSALQIMCHIDLFNKELNITQTQHAVMVGVIYCLSCLLLGILGWGLPNKKRSMAVYLYSHVSLAVYNFGNVLLMLMYGLLTMLMGVSFSGGLILGLILLGHKKTVFSLCFLIVSTAASFYAYQFGHIQYAYVMAEAETNNNLTWTVLIILNTMPHIVCLLYFAAQSTDAWRERERNIVNLSMLDPMTQCYNRRYLMEQAEEQIAHCLSSGESISVIMTDIDYFKKVNDSFGHEVGDQVIQYIARVLKDNIRRVDILSRYGGEEFCILMRNCNQDTAKLISERCRIQVQYTPLETDDQSIPLTASFGVITVTDEEIKEHQLSGYDLISYADRALYQAKKSGRNKCINAILSDM